MIDRGLWRTDDKEWMKARKEEWKKIVKSLDSIKVTKKKYYKYHKDYFFTGEYKISKEDWLESVDPFPYKLIFDMWYHPKKDLDTYKEIFNKLLNKEKQTPKGKVDEIRYNREFLFKCQSKCGPNSGYGIMGGREENVLKALYPSCSYDDVMDLGGVGVGRGILHLGPIPTVITSNIFGSSYNLLLRGKGKLHAPGQYLWNYLDCNINVVSEDEIIRHIIRILHIVKNQSDYPEFPKDNEYIVNYANNLKQRFETKEFSEKLTSYWNDVDDLYYEHFG